MKVGSLDNIEGYFLFALNHELVIGPSKAYFYYF